MQISYPIIFFDGKCGLCNKSIDRIISLDKNKVFRYAPLQGQTAMQLLPKELATKLETLIYFENGKFWTESEAVVKILRKLGGMFKFIGVILVTCPKLVRDYFYKMVSRNRYSWFGQSENCRIPTKEERTLFLD